MPVKPLTILILCMAALVVLATLCACWLWIMLRRPTQWLSFSDRIDEFAVRVGVISKSLAEKNKRINRGWGRKLLIGLVTTALIESAGGFLVFAFWIIRLEVLMCR